VNVTNTEGAVCGQCCLLPGSTLTEQQQLQHADRSLQPHQQGDDPQQLPKTELSSSSSAQHLQHQQQALQQTACSIDTQQLQRQLRHLIASEQRKQWQEQQKEQQLMHKLNTQQADLADMHYTMQAG
jgi:hypothetical protein